MRHEFKVDICFKPGSEKDSPSAAELALISQILPDLMELMDQLEEQEKHNA
jgi:hypothetical protein